MNRDLHRVSHERVDALTRALRACGTLVLMGAASAFLLGQWDGIGDVVKYFVLLGHTVMLLVAGLVTSAKAHDSRTARTFMLLTLGAIPINFAITGGFLYSQFALDPAVSLPSEITWVAGSGLVAVGIAVISAAVLFVASYVASRGLVRQQALPATLALLGSSAALWVPLREPSFAGVVLLCVACVELFFEARRWRRASCMRTLEGRLVRALIASPIVLGVARTVIYYGSSGVFLGGALMVAGLATFLLSDAVKDEDEHDPSTTVPVLSAVLSAVGCCAVIADLGATLHLGHVTAMWFVPSTVVLVGYSFATQVARTPLRHIAAWWALTLAVITLPFHFVLGNLMLALLIGVGALCFATWERNKSLAVVGSSLALLSLIGSVYCSIDLGGISSWVTLSGFGLVFILGAVIVERHRVQLVHSAVRLRDHFQDPPRVPPARGHGAQAA